MSQRAAGDAAEALAELIAVMAALRNPDGGCPWDLEQTFATIAPYTIEEAYELADAIARADIGATKDELGDLLFQVVYHARMAEEAGAFAFADVAHASAAKMIRRHPHVFADAHVPTAAAQIEAWEAIKAGERRDQAGTSPAGVLDGLPLALPGLTRALKLSERAARVGFAWPSTAEVVAKLREEIGELEAALAAGEMGGVVEELGDILFVCANIARSEGVDPESALRSANAKFARRFRFIEAALAAEGRAPGDSDLAEMDRLWDAAKAAERSNG